MIKLVFAEKFLAQDLEEICHFLFQRLSTGEDRWGAFWQEIERRRMLGGFLLGDGLLLPHCFWQGESLLGFLRLQEPMLWEGESVTHILFFCLKPEEEAEMRSALELCFQEEMLRLFLEGTGFFEKNLQMELKKRGICYEL